ncbi:hypothetical protein ACEWY4_026406 [Coilia grayii]|uniref:G-protein coupled receptors family 1 profile domain-containing protein n=1 Tax=Coilia grayii TaxID=363190 RepID=A0ABD1IWQ9_9TELE
MPRDDGERNFHLNSTSLVNHTDDFDTFCIELYEGPVVWAVFSVPCSLVGVLASVWLLRLLVQRLRSNMSNDIYMLNLTAMDLMFNISVLPAALSYFIWQNEAYLKICNFLFCLSMSGRPLFMACICVDCYMAVVHPISYRKLKGSRYRQVVCVLVWGCTLIFGLMFVVDPALFTTSYPAMPFALCLPPITFCDAAVFYALRKPDPSGKADVHPQKQRALQTITNSFVMTVVSYLPPLLVYGLTPVWPLTTQQIYCQVGIPTLITTTLGSTILPLLYLSNLGGLKDLRRCGCVRSL